MRVESSLIYDYNETSFFFFKKILCKSDLLAGIPVNHMYVKCPQRPEECVGFCRIRGKKGF